MSSTPFRASAAALALAALLSACAHVQPDVLVKGVPVDLAFGSLPTPTPTASQSDTPLPPTIDVPTVKLPDDPPDFTIPEVKCPPTPTALGARDPVVSSMDDRPYDIPGNKKQHGNTPRAGSYLFDFAGNFEDHVEQRMHNGARFITDVQQTQILPQQDFGYEYDLEDGFTRTQWQFAWAPIQRPQGEANKRPGFFFKKISLAPKGRAHDPTANLLDFVAASPIQMMSFPIQAGQQSIGSSPDVAFKRAAPKPSSTPSPVTTPTPVPPLFQPTGNTIKSQVDVGDAEQIDVCDQKAQAWRVNWTLQISGDFNFTLFGTFWLATQYGGWPVKDAYVITPNADVLSGTFSSNLQNLDPAETI